MTDREALTDTLETARADLITTIEALPAFAAAEPSEVPPDVCDVIWSVGQDEDWIRRSISASLEGRDPPDEVVRPRPAYLVTSELLVEWLRQSRRPTLVLLRQLDAANLLRTEDTFASLADRDREIAAQLRALAPAGDAS